MDQHKFDFAHLLQPVTVETFIREYWETKPLLVKRSDSSYFSHICTLADIESIVAFRQLKYAQLKVARVADDDSTSKALHVDPDATSDINQLYNSYGNGDTIALNHVQQYWEPAARLCCELENFFNFPIGVNAYVTPQHSQGFPPHFDTHDVFVMQIDGAKSWRIYGAAAQLPTGLKGNQPISAESLGDACQEIYLEAGDCLYIPRGHAHEARTTSASSIHFTIGIRPYTWSDLISEVLQAASQEDARLRSALPIGFFDDADAVTRMKHTLPDLIRALASDDRTGSGIDRLRTRLIDRMRPMPDGHFASLMRAQQIGPDTVVARRPGMLCHVSTQDAGVEIAFPGNRIHGPAEIEDAFRFIAQSTSAFSVASLPGGLGVNSKLVLARRAIQEGLLTIVDTCDTAATGSRLRDTKRAVARPARAEVHCE